MKFRPMPIENTPPPIQTKPPKIVNCKDTKCMNIDDASSIASPYLTSPIPETISQIPQHQSSSILCSQKKPISIKSPLSVSSPSKLYTNFPESVSPNHESPTPSSNPIVNPTHTSPHIESVLAQLKFGCRNVRNIINMRKNKSLTNLPPHLKELPHQCPICLKCKLTRLPRNPPLPVSTLRPGQMLQMDFAFMNVESARGFASYLSCDCVNYSFRFCTRQLRSTFLDGSLILCVIKRKK